MLYYTSYPYIISPFPLLKYRKLPVSVLENPTGRNNDVISNYLPYSNLKLDSIVVQYFVIS